MGGKGRTSDMKPGMIRAFSTLIEPKISVQVVYRRGVSTMWLSPKEAREFGSKLIDAAGRCNKGKESE